MHARVAQRANQSFLVPPTRMTSHSFTAHSLRDDDASGAAFGGCRAAMITTSGTYRTLDSRASPLVERTTNRARPARRTRRGGRARSHRRARRRAPAHRLRRASPPLARFAGRRALPHAAPARDALVLCACTRTRSLRRRAAAARVLRRQRRAEARRVPTYATELVLGQGRVSCPGLCTDSINASACA